MKHTDTVRKAAVKLLNKFENFKEPLAVFVTPQGGIGQTRIGTERFEALVTEAPEYLMGVYNGHALLDWIEDDLVEMGVA